MSGHPSSLQLERFSVDDLPAEAQEETRAHVQGCPACHKTVEELEEARRDCLRDLPPERLIARMAERRWPLRPGWSWIGFGALTAAAAALALVLVPRPDRVQLKGTGVSVYRKRADEVRLLAAEERIRAGDGLRVVLTVSNRQPAAAYFVDARGRVDRFLANGSTALEPGEHALPGAIVESPCVDLWLIVATGPSAAQRLEAALERARQDGLPPGQLWAPAGAVIRPLRCE